MTMKKGDDPKMQAAKWFLEFLSDDPEKMSDLDWQKRIVEAEHYFLRPTFWIVGEAFKEPMWHSKELLDEATGIEDFVAYIESDHAPYPWRANLKHVQAALKDQLKRILADDMINVTEVRLLCSIIDGKISLGYIPPEKLYEDSYSLPNLTKLAVISFAHALERIPPEAIRTCQECGRFFLHLSRKPRYFCSPRCTSKAMAKRVRERDIDKYRKKQRRVMKKRYREKRAQELGVPVSKVKIRRRSVKKEG
jgi:hypothetical protein